MHGKSPESEDRLVDVGRSPRPNDCKIGLVGGGRRGVSTTTAGDAGRVARRGQTKRVVGQRADHGAGTLPHDPAAANGDVQMSNTVDKHAFVAVV